MLPPETVGSKTICSVSYTAEPMSASVGLSGNHFYRKEDYTVYRDALGWLIKQQVKADHDVYRYTYFVQAHFFLSNWRKVDIDNLLKPVLDAGTGLIWADDNQVIEVYAVKHHGDAEAKVVFGVQQVGDFVDYKRFCIYCGKRLTGKGLKRKYCSTQCQNEAQRKGREITCEVCGRVFWSGRLRGNRKGGRRFCSRGCYNVWVKAHGDEMVKRLTKRERQ